MPETETDRILPDLVLVKPDYFPHQTPSAIPSDRTGQLLPGGKPNLEMITGGPPIEYGDGLSPQPPAVTAEAAKKIRFLENPLAGKAEGGSIHRLS